MHASSWLLHLGHPFRLGRSSRLGTALIACLLTAACGGSGSGGRTDAGAGGGADPGADTGGRAGDAPTTVQANHCAPNNRYARDAQDNLLPGFQDGSLALEKQWVAANFTQDYLWYREIPAVNANAPEFNTGNDAQSIASYFYAHRTRAREANGQAKDRFSFVYPSADYKRSSEAGMELGYGVAWVGDLRSTPRRLQVAVVYPGSPAEQGGLARGDTVEAVTIDGVTARADTTTPEASALWRQASYPTKRGQQVTFQVHSSTNESKTVTVAADEVVTQPVLVSRVIEQGERRIGYMNLMDFNLPAEKQMATAFEGFRDRNVQELVIDLRYNGGGYLYLASQLAYMAVGAITTRNKVFSGIEHNDKLASENEGVPFFGVESGYSGTNTVRGTALPALNLNRVTVLATNSTCSASEALINGLRGIGVTVDVVGSKTCGKPYGFKPKENCGLTYFPIMFRAVNARGESVDASGMAESCSAGDDLTQPLGDAKEGMLAAALAYRIGDSCPALKSAMPTGADQARRIRLPFQEGMTRYPESRE